MKQRSIAVIGSNIAALATATRLAVKGHKVHLFEPEAHPQTILQPLIQDGFRFDSLPFLFDRPRLMNELLSLADSNELSVFAYSRLPEIGRFFYDDGTFIDGHNRAVHFAKEVFEKTGEHPNKTYHYLQKIRAEYEQMYKLVWEYSPRRFSTYLRPIPLLALINFGRPALRKSLHTFHKSVFSHPRIIQLFNRLAVRYGSNPYTMPANLNLYNHIEHNQGVYWPEGGMYSIYDCLLKIAKKSGVKIEWNAPIKHIIVEGRKAKGIQIKERSVYFDRIVSAWTIKQTHQKLLLGKAQNSLTKQQEKPSSSLLVFYWGIKKTFPQLKIRNILFSINDEEEFDHIFQKKTIYFSPTIYLTISAKMQSSDAPPDTENWVVAVQTPANEGQNWKQLSLIVKNNILLRISKLLQTDIRPLIVSETIRTPVDFEQLTGASKGALYGGQISKPNDLFNRSSNKSKHFKHLYFCGRDVHPSGGEIAQSLASAKIVSRLI